jgi:hypothetical protein
MTTKIGPAASVWKAGELRAAAYTVAEQTLNRERVR